MRLLDHIEAFINQLGESGLAERTIASYKRDLSYLASFIKRNDLQDITPSDKRRHAIFHACLDDLAGHYKPATLKRARVALRRFDAFIDPSGSLPALTTPTSRADHRVILSEEQVDRVLAIGINPTPLIMRNWALFNVLYGSGLHVSEAASLKLKHVRATSRSIRFDREQPDAILSSRSAQALQIYLDEGRPLLFPSNADPSQQAHVFLTSRGRPLSERTIRALVKAEFQRAHIDTRLPPDVLRQSYAVHMYQTGATLQRVQRFLRHRHLSTTRELLAVDTAGVWSPPGISKDQIRLSDNIYGESMSFAYRRNFFVVHHYDLAPSDLDWTRYTQTLFAIGQTYRQLNILVSTPISSPNGDQHALLEKITEQISLRIALLSQSKIALHVAQLVDSFPHVDVGSFASTSLDDALSFLNQPPDAQGWVEELLNRGIKYQRSG